MQIIQTAFDFQLKLRATLEKTDNAYKRRVLLADIKENADYLQRLDIRLTKDILHEPNPCEPVSLEVKRVLLYPQTYNPRYVKPRYR